MPIGNRIQMARERLGKGYTQEWLGKHFDITGSAVSIWERGGDPEADKIPLIRKLLRVTFAWLLLESGKPPPDPGDPAVLFEDSLHQHAEILAKKPPPPVPKPPPKPKRKKSN